MEGVLRKSVHSDGLPITNSTHGLLAVLEDGDQAEVLLALRRITTAFGGVPKLAEQTDLNATRSMSAATCGSAIQNDWPTLHWDKRLSWDGMPTWRLELGERLRILEDHCV